MDDSKILMKSIFPDLVNKIKQVFAEQDRRDLYEQINDLVIVSLCKCGEESCGSFYTVDPPDENTEHKVEDFVIVHGQITVEVYDGKVTYIEILPSTYGCEIRKEIENILI